MAHPFILVVFVGNIFILKGLYKRLLPLAFRYSISV